MKKSSKKFKLREPDPKTLKIKNQEAYSKIYQVANSMMRCIGLQSQAHYFLLEGLLHILILKRKESLINKDSNTNSAKWMKKAKLDVFMRKNLNVMHTLSILKS